MRIVIGDDVEEDEAFPEPVDLIFVSYGGCSGYAVEG